MAVEGHVGRQNNNARNSLLLFSWTVMYFYPFNFDTQIARRT